MSTFVGYLMPNHPCRKTEVVSIHLISVSGQKNKILLKTTTSLLYLVINHTFLGGARGVMVIVVGNGHRDSSSNPGRD